MATSFALHTAFLLTVGLMDNVGPAAQVGASVRNDWETLALSLGVELRGVFPGSSGARIRNTNVLDVTEPPLTPVPFDASELGGNLVTCVHFVRFSMACPVVRGFVHFLDAPGGVRSKWGMGVGLRIGFEVPIAEPFSFFGFVEGIIPTIVPEEQFDNVDDPTKPGPFWIYSLASGFFGAGVSYKFE